MNRSTWSRSTAAIEIVGLLVFTTAAPLAHLHQRDRIPPGPRHVSSEHQESGVLFHAHVDAHHGAASDKSGPESREDDAAAISYGEFDIPRSHQTPEPSAEVILFNAPSVPSFLEGLVGWSEPPERAHGPPARARQPVRGPPSSV